MTADSKVAIPCEIYCLARAQVIAVTGLEDSGSLVQETSAQAFRPLNSTILVQFDDPAISYRVADAMMTGDITAVAVSAPREYGPAVRRSSDGKCFGVGAAAMSFLPVDSRDLRI